MFDTGFPTFLSIVPLHSMEPVSHLTSHMPNVWEVLMGRAPVPPVRPNPRPNPTGIDVNNQEVPAAVTTDPDSIVMYPGETAHRNEQEYRFRDGTRAFVSADPNTPGDKVYRIHSGERDANGRPKTTGVVRNGRFYYVTSGGTLHPEQGFLRDDPLLPASIKNVWRAMDSKLDARRADDVIKANPQHADIFGDQTARRVQEAIDEYNARPSSNPKIPTQGWELYRDPANNTVVKNILAGPNGFVMYVGRDTQGNKVLMIGQRNQANPLVLQVEPPPEAV